MNRGTIRATALTVLRGALAIPTERITPARGLDFNLDQLPAATVSTPDEDAALQSRDGDTRTETTLRITFFGRKRLVGDVESELDAYAEAAVAALQGSSSFTALHKGILNRATQFSLGDRGESAPAQMDLTLTLLRFEE